MRIFSYNILDGGEGRADPLAEVIQAQNADVVALIEAEDSAVLDRIARRLQMDCVQGFGQDGKASAILSRWPIRDSVNHAALRPAISKSLLQATILGPGGEPWNFGAVHLHAHAAESDEQARERELAEILPIFEPLRRAGTPHVLLGDFNANAPGQRIDLAKCKPSTQEEAQQNGGAIPRRVVQALLDAGYLDTYQVLHPQQAAVDGTFSTQYPAQRVDYIFTHSIARERITRAWIEYDRLAKYASDHFPIGAEIAE